MSRSFDRLCITPAHTNRNPATSSGKISAPVLYLSDLLVLAPLPLRPEVAEQYRLNSPRRGYQSFANAEYDIKEGDQLVIEDTDEGDVTYSVKAASPWPDDYTYLELILERVIAG